MVLLLVLAVVLQARQYGLLRQATQNADELAVLKVYEAQAEYLRLREQWWRTQQRLGAGGSDSDAGAEALAESDLRLRYDHFVSRVDLLQGERLQALLDGQAEHMQTVQDLRRFIGRANAALGPAPTQALDADFMQRLQADLQGLAAPVQAMSMGAARGAAARAQAQYASMRDFTRLDLALTVALALLATAFAAIALRQLRQLRERRLALEEAATQLRLARRVAESASEAKSVFLANMSHEIRTPFHGLMGMLSLLRETGLTPRQTDFLRTATESADHLLAVLNGILDMSQLESGRMTLSPAPVDLRSLLREVEALMRPPAMAKALALHLDTDPQVPERVLLDGTRVKQILFNLLSNAIKFSDRGVVVLDLRMGTDAQGGDELRFVVTDTGSGMDEATVARLFHRFAQGEAPRTRRQGGTGLGLEISRNLARLMGGDVTVRSRPGEGSCFTLHLPLTKPPEPVTEAGARPGLGAVQRPLQVLVAEDHPVNRQYMGALLENLGHRPEFVANGDEAVAAVQRRHFDLVLMDLHMPQLDGVGATRAIRALPAREKSTLPIVALTADAFDETRERCLVAGMNDFLTKPVSPQKLSTALRRLFGVAGTLAAPGTGLSAARAPMAAKAPMVGQLVLIDAAAIEMALQALSRPRLAALIEAFLAQGPQTVQRLRTAIRDAQPLELRINAHAARGAALNLGLTALAATAESLHEGAAHLPAHEIARLVQRYEDLLPATRAAAREAGLVPEPAATAD